MNYFKCIWRVLTTYIKDWKEVSNNIRNPQRRWAQFHSILGWEGANARTSRILYRAFGQPTLLFVSYTWVMTPSIDWTLGAFNHRVACCIAEMNPRKDNMRK